MHDDRSISRFFQTDHAEIDALLDGVDMAAPGEAAERFARFVRRLERHIAWEEDILFPAAGAVEPTLRDGPLRVMRLEHAAIRGHMAGVLQALRAGDKDGALARLGDLSGVLGPHNAKEERILYPACDRLLAGDGARAVLEAVGKSVA